MDERYAAVPSTVLIFRLAETGTHFLPAGQVLPDPLLFRPSSQDEREAVKSSRSPGVTVWDRSRSTVAEARLLSDKPDGQAFGFTVKECIEVGAKHEVRLTVVRDPLTDRKDQPGWDGHALVEGLQRPPDRKDLRKVYRRLREDLSAACRAIE